MAAALPTPAWGGTHRLRCSSAWREPPNGGAVPSNAVPCTLARVDRPLLALLLRVRSSQRPVYVDVRTPPVRQASATMVAAAAGRDCGCRWGALHAACLERCGHCDLPLACHGLTSSKSTCGTILPPRNRLSR